MVGWEISVQEMHGHSDHLIVMVVWQVLQHQNQRCKQYQNSHKRNQTRVEKERRMPDGSWHLFTSFDGGCE